MIRRVLVLALIVASGCNVVKVVPPDESHPNLIEPANMGFEEKGASGGAETWWRSAGPETYEMELDKKVKKSGRYSARITFSGGAEGWGAWNQNYLLIGRKALHIKGWIKTEGADTCPECSKPGHDNDSLPEGQRRGAEIRLNLYPEGNYTMLTPLVVGTSNWTLFEARADVPPGTTQLILAPILWGKGKAWFDDLTLTLE